MGREGRLNPEKVPGGPLLPETDVPPMPSELKAALVARGYVLASELAAFEVAPAKKKAPKRPPKDKMIWDAPVRK